MAQPFKAKERKIAARLQAVDGKWPEEFPPVSETGRVGHIDEASVPFDGLTKSYAMEAKSSSSNAKDPGHRISKKKLQKIQKGSDKFGQRWVYAVDLPYCSVGHMISQTWHFRYLLAFRKLCDLLEMSEEDMKELLDQEIEDRLQSASKSYR